MEKRHIVEIKINGDDKTYLYYSNLDLEVNSKVIVERDSCLFMAKVIGFKNEKPAEKLNVVVRLATAEDLQKDERNEQKASSAILKAKDKAKQLKLEMKIISCSYCLDASKMIILFSSENRVDFREYVKDLANMFKTRIELKQIGSRDEVKVVGGLGVCGKVCCCKEFLPEFSKVSIRMAKTQNLSLNPQKINGLCGRLMCCLSFENEAYAKIMAKMPKLNSEVNTPEGKGPVVYNDVLSEKVSVRIADKDGSFAIKEFPLSQIEVKVYAIKD